jgi:thioredoxin reductase (NADPH)
VPEEAVSLKREDGYYSIGLSEGGEVVARSVIAASGARYRMLDVPRLGLFEGVSIHYAATEAEAQQGEGEEVAVVGGGNSAGQTAVYLAGRTRRVYLLIRGDDLGKSMSRYLVGHFAPVPKTSLFGTLCFYLIADLSRKEIFPKTLGGKAFSKTHRLSERTKPPA